MVEVTSAGLLFDLDGVLVDSTPAVARVWRKWAIAHGFDPEETVRIAHGRPSVETVRDLLPSSDVKRENDVILRGEIEDTEGVVALPGARALLNFLPEERWALVTSCSRPLAEVRLCTAGLPVPNRMITSDDVRNGKPHPEPYRRGAELLGVPASECVVFEDAPAGIRAGKAAGARVIALRSTSPDSELEQAGADWILSSYHNLTVIPTDHGSNRLRLLLEL
ncbi:MAG: HAD family hydrolase [Acidobacteria bacterium]|nr:HAD family hydrolase [Acidobacteriota bacterium]